MAVRQPPHRRAGRAHRRLVVADRHFVHVSKPWRPHDVPQAPREGLARELVRRRDEEHGAVRVREVLDELAARVERLADALLLALADLEDLLLQSFASHDLLLEFFVELLELERALNTSLVTAQLLKIPIMICRI